MTIEYATLQDFAAGREARVTPPAGLRELVVGPRTVEWRAGFLRVGVTGYAAKWNLVSETIRRIGKREVVRRGAFRSRAGGVAALVGHDHSRRFASTEERTLRIFEDHAGLRYEALVPDTVEGRGIVEDVRHGRLIGISPAFGAIDERAILIDGQAVRELRAIDLPEISLVNRPAWSGTTLRLWIPPVTGGGDFPTLRLAIARNQIAQALS